MEEAEKDKEVINYIVKKVTSAKAVFILDGNGHWEFYGDIPKLHNMPKDMQDPIIQYTPETPEAWWNPSVFESDEEELGDLFYNDHS
jgi:hypothetical protein